MLKRVVLVIPIVGLAILGAAGTAMAFVPLKGVPECVTITPGERPIIGNGEVCNTSGDAPPPVISHPGRGIAGARP